MLGKSPLKRLLSKWKSRGLGHFIVNKLFVNGTVEVQGPGDLHTFTVKGKRIKIYVEDEMPFQKVSITTTNP